jgi:hypothetical protein
MSDSNYDFEFYKKQNDIMEERNSKIFEAVGLSWSKYIKNARYKLKNNIYWIWVFLCGFETFLKENSNLKYNDKNYLNNILYKDAEDRIYRIIGDHNKVEDYIKSL